MEKQPGSKEQRAVESKKTQETGVKNMRRAAESVSSAGAGVKKGFEILGSKNVSPESKKTVRTNLDSLKRTAGRLGAVLALSMPAAMLGHITYVEGTRPHEDPAEHTSSEDNVPENEEYAPVAPLPTRRERTLDPETQLTRNMLLELAQLLNEHEAGLDEPVSASELGQLTAETAVSNALEGLNHSDGRALAEHVRQEIEAACSAPECDPEYALGLAASLLEGGTVGADYEEVTNVHTDENFAIYTARSELDGSTGDLSHAVAANRPDLVEAGLRRRIDNAASEEEASTIVAQAISRIDAHSLAAITERMSPQMQAEMQQAITSEELRLRNERATLVAALAGINQAENRAGALEIGYSLSRIDQNLSRLNQVRNQIS